MDRIMDEWMTQVVTQVHIFSLNKITPTMTSRAPDAPLLFVLSQIEERGVVAPRKGGLVDGDRRRRTAARCRWHVRARARTGGVRGGGVGVGDLVGVQELLHAVVGDLSVDEDGGDGAREQEQRPEEQLEECAMEGWISALQTPLVLIEN